MAFVRWRKGSWRVRYRDAAGVVREAATKARSKSEAKRFGLELERRVDRQKLGMEPLPGDATLSVDDLCNWWLENRCPAKSLEGNRNRLEHHVIGSRLGKLPLSQVTPGRIEEQFRVMEKGGLGPASINHVRGNLRRVYNTARKAGIWTSQNPVIDTEPRRVPRRIYDTLTAEEADALLPWVPEVWRGFLATALYLGLRKGEVAGLRKRDVNLELGEIIVRASYDSDTTKGGHADALPIPAPLRPFLKAGLMTRGPYLFPDEVGHMRGPLSGPEHVLRRAMVRAELVEGWEHVCRRCKHAKKKGHTERHDDSGERNCKHCQMKLWPKAVQRKLRFHDLRHSCATILLRAGVDIHRVQRILRQASVTTTSTTYAHLQQDDLREGLARAFGAPRETKPLEVIAVAASAESASRTGPERAPVVEAGPGDDLPAVQVRFMSLGGG